ncbi:coproporphyrinogen-III oxidase family protein [Mesorhizobium sp. CO1-1-8]|uniref:coproporphyrinogen-III oxidase family protein n=1 Tax=Mesorhizobium sp. CO1-1-8 TaxID=2876631 RepID=UPI001CD0D3F8|nr:coproporphyrinogen-III oxidase family protein [Mesorhizobium sp. CO1-1-8]MBZ9770996.1 coproporphyrinogen III oxidase family protein [Mesorhizobium sp. CO1-1-8]
MNKTAGPRGVHFYPVTSKGLPIAPVHIIGSGPIALYVHIPFCEKRCHFCEFAVVADRQVTDELVANYLEALRKEIRAFLEICATSPKVSLIQFGGGTPTALSAADLGKLLDFIFEQFDCAELEEVIVEGFPTTITSDRIAVLERVPNIKLNIGVQSFHPECLEAVGRDHGLLAREAIENAAASRIGSVGVDLIFGLPSSAAETVQSDIETAAQCGAEHFAFYPLWVYDQTTLKTRVRNGRVELPGHAAQYDQLLGGGTVLADLGYERYTSFHYALRPDARHYYGLWQMQACNWIGFGMSAMSHLEGHIRFNDRSIRSYIDKVESGATAAVEQFLMTKQQRMQFEFLYRLRIKAFSTTYFFDRFGISVEAAYGDKLAVLEKLGLIRVDAETVALTLRGTLRLREIEDYINKISELPADFAMAVSAEV